MLIAAFHFYVDHLGFNLIFDSEVGSGRFVVVGSPDCSAVTWLSSARTDSEESRSVGRSGPLVFLTENVISLYEE